MLFSICIPTFNRPEKVHNLLNYIEGEINNTELSNLQIEIILGDNSSNYETQNICSSSKLNKKNILKYIKNKSNLGLVGNILNLLSLANGDYVWFMGDDDLYHKNLISVIKETLIEDDYSFIFLNHRAYEENKKGYSGFNSAVDLNRKVEYDDGKEMMFDIWNYSCTSMMFISACIFRNKDLKACLNSKQQINLAYPMYMSFYCASRGKTKIIKQICIDNIWGKTSWTKSSSDVFLNYVPHILYKLPTIGYRYIDSRKILFKYTCSRFKAIIIYQIKKTLRLS